VGKSGPTIWASFVIFKKLPKVNTHPIGEKSPNLVTLLSIKVGPFLRVMLGSAKSNFRKKETFVHGDWIFCKKIA
jgi:hypothetical protein